MARRPFAISAESFFWRFSVVLGFVLVINK